MKLHKEDRRRLAEVLDYLYADEETDFYRFGKPLDHVFHAVRALDDKLKLYNIYKAQKSRRSK